MANTLVIDLYDECLIAVVTEDGEPPTGFTSAVDKLARLHLTRKAFPAIRVS